MTQNSCLNFKGERELWKEIYHKHFWSGARGQEETSVQEHYFKKRETKNGEHLQAYLEQLQRAGVELFVDGEAVLPVEVVRRTVQEECAYMADYIVEKPGKIAQVRFDRVEL